MKKAMLAAFLFLGVLAFGQTFDDSAIVTKFGTDEVVEYTKYLGYVPEIDSDGDVKIKINGRTCFITADDSTIQIYAIFKGPVDKDQINTMNSSKRWSKSYWTEKGNLIVDCDLDIGFGVSYGNIRNWLLRFGAYLDNY